MILITKGCNNNFIGQEIYTGTGNMLQNKIEVLTANNEPVVFVNKIEDVKQIGINPIDVEMVKNHN